jgi:AAA domain-containing protein
MVWSLNDCPPKYGQPGDTLLDMLRDVRPLLAMVDSLSSYAPEAEEKNSAATEMLQDFRSIARDCGTGVMLVHHRRKQSRKVEESAGPLENSVLRRWFQDARGASALVNGTDIRLGIDEPDIGVVGKDNASLVCRGFGRIRGEIGPIYLAREVDDVGDPLGYRHLTGPELLFNPKQQAALASLPADFAFKEAKAAYGHADQATINFLRRCIAHQLVRRVARGRYEKIEPQEVQTAGALGE